MQPSVAYHQLARSNGRARAVVEILLAAVIWFVLINVVGAIIVGVADVQLSEADGAWGLVALAVGLGSIVPATMLSARALGRKPGHLSSVAGRLRWRLLAKLSLIAFAIKAVHLAADFGLTVARTGLDAATAGYAWPGLEAFLLLALLIVVMLSLQIAGEEYFFRGTLLQAIGAFTQHAWVGIAITSILFTLVHGAPIEATVAIAVFGAAAAWLTIRTGGLEAALALHASNNILSFILTAATGGSATWIAKINHEGDWLTTALDVAVTLVYTAVVVKVVSAQRAPAVADQVE